MSKLKWHYGPTDTNPDPGRMWHYECGKEVLYIEDGYICECGDSDSYNSEEDTLYLNIRFKKLSTTAITPTYAHENDAGMDLYADQDFMIHIGQNSHIPTGIAIEIPLGYFGLIRPRSGMARDYSIISGGSDVIDSDYRGEVMVNLINYATRQRYEIHRGDRIAQLLILPVYHAILEEINELSTTSRGPRGHGSTGK